MTAKLIFGFLLLLIALPAEPDPPIKGNKTSIWVRRYYDDKALFVAEPVFTPELLLRPVSGSGTKKLQGRLGGVVTCTNIYVVVTWTNSTQEQGKLHRLDCDGEIYEVMHVNLRETK